MSTSTVINPATEEVLRDVDLLDVDAERTIRNYSDPDGLFKLLENHRPEVLEVPEAEPVDAKEPETEPVIESAPSE